MPNLEQVKLSYDQVQDRLLLIFFTSDFSEFRFWITRSMTKKMVDVLKQVQAKLMKSTYEQQSETQKAQQNVQQEVVQHEVNRYGMQITRNPAEPQLLAQIKINILESELVNFQFEGANKISIDLTFNKTFVVTLLQLVEKTLSQIDWKLG